MRRSAQLVICLTVFVDLLGFTLILPALPFYAAELGAGGLWFGALMASYSLAQFVSAPVLGRLSDRYGRRPLVLVALIGSVLSLALTGAAGSLGWLLAGRLLAGAFGGSIAVAQAYIGDAVAPQRRTGAMAQMGAAIAMAFVVGPALGAALAPWGFAASAYAAAALAAVNLLAAALFLPEPARRPREERPSRAPAGQVLLLTTTQFLAMAAFVGMETTLAFLGQARFGWSVSAIGLVLAAAGLAMVVVQAGPVALLARRWGEAPVAAAGVTVMAISMPVVALASQVWCVVAVCLLAAGHGMVTPTLASLLAAAGPPQQRGARLGLGQSASAAARVLAPAGAGALFDLTVVAPYLAGTGLAGLAAACVLAAPAAVRDGERA
ncbi:MFS transporter [Streptosporangium sp. LJ11]|uniref:MFS transporter n=1 Tax=Streptosporangium sp. LJ11 TaxID=3436927 RepID=UPI003F7A7B89